MKLGKLIILTFLFALVLGLSSCKESTIEITGLLKKPPTTGNNTDTGVSNNGNSGNNQNNNNSPASNNDPFINNFITGYDVKNRFFFWNNGQIYFPPETLLSPSSYSFSHPSFTNSYYTKNYYYATANGVLFFKGQDTFGKKFYWKNLIRHEYSMEDKASGKQFTSITIEDYLNTIENDLYSYGYAFDGVSNIPVFWKNEELIPLQISKDGEDFTSYNFTGPYVQSSPAFVNGNDFYIFGQASSSSWTGLVYWKNGEIFKLINNNFSGSPQLVDVRFVANDIYVFAYGSENVSGNYSYIFTYWKNDMPVMPSDLTRSMNIPYYPLETISIQNNNVYFVGTVYRNSEYLPALWINGQENLLPKTDSSLVELNNFSFHGTKILNGDQYILGSATKVIGGVSVPLIWKNGILSILSPKDSSGDVLSFYGTLTMGGAMPTVYFDENNFFWMGNFYNSTNNTNTYGYYKNNQLILLSNNDSFQISQQNLASVRQNDFYVFGTTYDSLGKYSPAYWKNGVLKNLDTIDEFGDEVFVSPSYLNFKFNPNGDLFICAQATINNPGGAQYVAYWLNDKLYTLTKPTGGLGSIGICQ